MPTTPTHYQSATDIVFFVDPKSQCVYIVRSILLVSQLVIEYEIK